MGDFQFLQNPVSGKWVILAPKRAKRPDFANGTEPVCPFCPGKEGEEREVYRVQVEKSEILNPKSETLLHIKLRKGKQIACSAKLQRSGVSNLDIRDSNLANSWLVRVLNNKFPFAPVHEVIVHSPDHHKNFDELSIDQVNLIFQVYRNRFLAHQEKGQVVIFHNRGEAGGESLPHPHTQLAVVPFEVKIETPGLDPSASASIGPRPLEAGDSNLTMGKIETVQTNYFYLFCPKTSQWPDEVWVAPKKRGRLFGEIADEEIFDLAEIVSRLIQIFDLRHGNEFSYNFYIYPGVDWYLRLIPRIKRLGGFEISTGIFVNTQDPKETIAFIKEHYQEANIEKIKREHQAEYEKTV